MYWGVLIDVLAGSMHKITKIKGSSSYNVEDYGIALAKGHGAGLTMAEFDKEIGAYNDLSYREISAKIESGEYPPPYMWNQNGWLFLMSLTSSAFAPQLPNPVEVFTKSAPAFTAVSQAFFFSNSFK